MNEEQFSRLSLRFDILNQMGFNDYKLKIWIMSHMDQAIMIDAEGFGRYSCKSFMDAGLKYEEYVKIAEKLVDLGIFYKPAPNAPIMQYKFKGEAQQYFKKLLIEVEREITKQDPYDVFSLFSECLDKQNEPNFIVGNKKEYFTKLHQDPSEIKVFLKNFLIANATSYGIFILSLFLK